MSPPGSPWGRRLRVAVARALGADPVGEDPEGEVDLDVGPGAVVAHVDDPSGQPHRVRIGLAAFDEDTWDAVAATLAADAWTAATLLAGEMPGDLDERLAGVVGSLLPRTARELPVDCPCRDWAVPCRHAAAAIAALGRRVEADPFELVRWRGRSPAALQAAIREHRETAAPTPPPRRPAGFWSAGGPVPPTPDPPPGEGPEDLLDRVPPTGVDVDGRDLRDALRPVYRRFAAHTRRPGPAPGDRHGPVGDGGPVG